MRAKRVSFPTMKTDIIALDGGLDENVSSLDRKGGTLISGFNYELLEGTSGGYISTTGYERFDGQEAPSSVYATEEGDVDREAARTAILEVPGEDAVLAVHIFDNDVYAFRNKTGGATVGMYIATAAGWVEINTTAAPLEPDGSYNFINHNFFATVETTAMYWTDGVNKARKYDGTTLTVITTGMTTDTPTNLIAHNDRLFLSFTGGSLQYSVAGDGTDWSAGAGELGVGREITDLIAGVGNALIIFCDEAIRILKGTVAADWILETYSTSSGAYLKSAQRLFGTVFFMDDRGVTSLEAVQDFGDFKSNSLSQKVYKTLQENKSYVTTAVVSRDKNQYRLFLSTSNIGIYFSFLDRELRGITLVKFDHPVLTTAEGENSSGDNIIFFTSTDGYVYQMDSGTSFDGSEINAEMATAYYHYRSPRLWKKFCSASVEIASLDDLTLSYRVSFDYNELHLPRAGIHGISLDGFGDKWGEDEWGTMIYGGSEVTNRTRVYIKGIGTNMNMYFSTSSKYADNHTIQNIITDYELAGRQL